MANQLLLIEDVYPLGRIGDIVSVRPGYARNCLLPGKKAIVANKNTVRLQAKLQEERTKRIAAEKEEAEALAASLNGQEFTILVKADAEGRLYGSVVAADIARVVTEGGNKTDKKNVVLVQPIKALGTYDITLRLKGDVTSQVKIHVQLEPVKEQA